MAGRDRRLALAAGLLALLLAAAFVRELLRAQAPGSGPVPLAWDHEACTRCRMLISEPRFAGQVRDADGHVHPFDDPGCLLLWLEENDVEPAEIWFHHLDEDRWVSGERAVFVPVESTPMAYGLGVRDSGEGLDLAQARAAVGRTEARRHPAAEAPRRPTGEAPRVP
jgi:hypothetical protein